MGRALDTNYGGNPGFVGEMYELLIYSSPLTDAMMATVLADVQAANRLRADAKRGPRWCSSATT